MDFLTIQKWIACIRFCLIRLVVIGKSMKTESVFSFGTPLDLQTVYSRNLLPSWVLEDWRQSFLPLCWIPQRIFRLNLLPWCTVKIKRLSVHLLAPVFLPLWIASLEPCLLFLWGVCPSVRIHYSIISLSIWYHIWNNSLVLGNQSLLM